MTQTPGGAWRVSARVGGEEVWFEADVPLEPASEAFASAFLIPAMKLGLNLTIEGPVCATWLANMDRVRAIAEKWWLLKGGAIRSGSVRGLPPAYGRALFYGGGADSAFALYREQKTLTHLVYVEGFDVKLTDHVRLDQVRQYNRLMAQACGLQLITVRTNLRAHLDFNALTWDNTFGGALAGVAQLLQRHCGTFLISGDGHLSEIDPHALGIHPDLTPQWASSSVRFIHYGEGVSRHAKVGAIGQWPIIRESLRVCWQYLNQNMNCGVCEKCLRTRIAFLAAGITESLPAFPDEPIIEHLNKIRRLSPNLYLYYQEMFDDLKDPALRQAILDLGQRTQGEGKKGLPLSPP